MLFIKLTSNTMNQQIFQAAYDCAWSKECVFKISDFWFDKSWHVWVSFLKSGSKFAYIF